jgi:hypothetical protein
MKNLGLFIAGIVTAILALLYLPPFIIYLIGCFQIGSWIGSYIQNKRFED